MTKGLVEKNLDEIEAAQKIIQLAQDKQWKAQDELKIVHKEKRNLKLGEKATQKTKSQVNVCFQIYYFSRYWTTIIELTKDLNFLPNPHEK